MNWVYNRSKLTRGNLWFFSNVSGYIVSKSQQASIFHIALQADVDDASKAGQYVCDSLSTEGFIHCCLAGQLKGVVERYYQDTKGLLLLELTPALLTSTLRYENTVGGDEEFPHIYGPINLDAIVSTGPLA